MPQRPPTPEERLARITDPHQRRVLLLALARGETIPEAAWVPFHEMSPIVQALIKADPAETGGPPASVLRPKAWFPPPVGFSAGELRRFLDDETILLNVPFERFADADVTMLFGWGIFNPLGPTMATMNLVEAGPAQMLVYSYRHPLQQRDVGYAAIPHEVARNKDSVRFLVSEVCSRNGSPGYPLLPGSLPSHVFVPAGGPLKLADMEGALRRLLVHSRPENLYALADKLERFRGRPWDRASSELDDAVNAIVHKVDPIGARWPPDDRTWSTWWRAVTDEEHVASEMGQMQAAWVGSIQQAGQRPK